MKKVTLILLSLLSLLLLSCHKYPVENSSPRNYTFPPFPLVDEIYDFKSNLNSIQQEYNTVNPSTMQEDYNLIDSSRFYTITFNFEEIIPRPKNINDNYFIRLSNTKDYIKSHITNFYGYPYICIKIIFSIHFADELTPIIYTYNM